MQVRLKKAFSWKWKAFKVLPRNHLRNLKAFSLHFSIFKFEKLHSLEWALCQEQNLKKRTKSLNREEEKRNVMSSKAYAKKSAQKLKLCWNETLHHDKYNRKITTQYNTIQSHKHSKKGGWVNSCLFSFNVSVSVFFFFVSFIHSYCLYTTFRYLFLACLLFFLLMLLYNILIIVLDHILVFFFLFIHINIF